MNVASETQAVSGEDNLGSGTSDDLRNLYQQDEGAAFVEQPKPDELPAEACSDVTRTLNTRPLENYVARCDGGNCPSKKNCRRYAERISNDLYMVRAALWLRRDAGASACDMVIWIDRVTTFKDATA